MVDDLLEQAVSIFGGHIFFVRLQDLACGGSEVVLRFCFLPFLCDCRLERCFLLLDLRALGGEFCLACEEDLSRVCAVLDELKRSALTRFEVLQLFTAFFECGIFCGNICFCGLPGFKLREEYAQRIISSSSSALCATVGQPRVGQRICV